MSDVLKIALIGAGHLGGSLALALRESGTAAHITAYDTKKEHAEFLLERGAADAVAYSAADAVREASLVILATPLRSYRALAEAIAPALPADAVITDVGSVKRSMAVFEQRFGARVVPGHPIAGSERSGPQAARGDLFKGRLCVLTPGPQADAQAIRLVETIWFAAGSEVLSMPVEVHDAVYAHVSHLPHFIAFASAEFFSRLGARIEAGDEVLQKFLRISRSNPRMWTDVALENREALLSALATYTAVLNHIAGELRGGDKAPEADVKELAKRLLPRILASSLISSVTLYEQQSGMPLAPFGAGGLRDIIAPVMGEPEPDIEAISAYSPLIADMLEEMVALMKKLEALIGEENEPELFKALSGMVEHAHELVSLRQ